MSPRSGEGEEIPLLSDGKFSENSSRAAGKYHDCTCPSCDPRRAVVQDNLQKMCHAPALYAPVNRNSSSTIEFVRSRIFSRHSSSAHQQSLDPEHAGKTPTTVKIGDTPHKHRVHLAPEVRHVVRTMYIIAFSCMAMMTSISPTLLLYMRHVGFIPQNSESVQFYVTCNVVASALPVLSHAGLGILAAKVGPARALVASCFVVSLGLLGMATITFSKFYFLLAFTCYSVSQSIRTIRTLVISQSVPHDARTEVMSMHALMTPLGALCGPLLWLSAERYQGEIQIFGTFWLNKFTVDYIAAASIALIMAAVSFARLRHFPVASNQESPVEKSSHPENNIEREAIRPDAGTLENEPARASLLPSSRDEDVVHIRLSNGREWDVDTNRYRRDIFIYFGVVMACVNLSMGLYSVAWQPIMVNSFGADGQRLGLIYELISVLAVIPPLLVAYLSRHLQDRQILVIGICAKIVGVLCFMPLFGPVREWQVVLGFIIIIKASIFFFTSSMALFTKLLGGMTTGTLVGVLSSVSALGPALAQVFFADYMLKRFGGFTFGLFGLPVLFALVLVLWPWFWKRLDVTREFTRALLVEYEATHNHQSTSH